MKPTPDNEPSDSDRTPYVIVWLAGAFALAVVLVLLVAYLLLTS